MLAAMTHAGWVETFENYGFVHAITAGSLIGSMIASVLLGRLWQGTRRELVLRYGWAGFTLVWQVGATIWWLLPANFDLYESLPLHLCDMAAWMAPFALVCQHRTLRALLFFWGLGLSTQAFVSPVVAEGVGSVAFWLFWVGHTQIVGSALYDTAVLGFRPRRRDFLTAASVSTAIAGIMMVFDTIFDVNYWFVGDASPSAPTVVDFLGDWPLRVVWMALLGNGIMALLWGMFALARCITRDHPTGHEVPDASSAQDDAPPPGAGSV